jgi:hypothetical protein
MRLAILLCLLIVFTACLNGCAGAPKIPPAPEVVEIKVPYLVPCIDAMPAKPTINSDMDLLALNNYDFVQAIHTDRLKLDEYALKLEIIALACMADPARSDPSPSPRGKPDALRPASLFPPYGTGGLAFGLIPYKSFFG